MLPPRPRTSSSSAASDWPVIRTFLANSSQWEHQAIRRFWVDQRESAAVLSRYRQLANRDDAMADRYAQEHGPALERARMLQKTADRMGKLAKARRALFDDPAMDGEQLEAEERKINEAMLELARAPYQ